MVLPGLPRIETAEPLRMTFRCPTHGPVDAILQWHPVGESPRIRASCGYIRRRTKSRATAAASA